MWFIYIVRCADGSLYTGISTDPERRLEEHNSGKGSKYLRAAEKCPAILVYREAAANQSAALRREAAIKRMTRQEKLDLIQGASDEHVSTG